jgi:hypothetical protein
MKIFASILSFYLLVLTAIPCIDVPEDNTLHPIEIGSTASHNHQNDIGHCSPFCTCNCCTSPIFYQAYTFQLNMFSLVQEYYSEHNSGRIFSLYTSIWQPPKLI